MHEGTIFSFKHDICPLNHVTAYHYLTSLIQSGHNLSNSATWGNQNALLCTVNKRPPLCL